MKHKILITITLVVFTSCMKLKKKDEEGVTPRNEPVQIQATIEKPKAVEAYREELTYNYLEANAKALNQVQFFAPTDWPNALILKKIDKEIVTEIGIQFDANKIWIDFLASENKITYKFYSKVGSELILLDEVEVIPILNLDLNEDLNLAQKYQLNSKTKLIYFSRLSIDDKSHLYFEDYTGKIVIQKLDSNSGYLQTFPHNGRASDGKNGRSGGHLEIQVISGSGTLNVFMIGESGGNGSPAKIPDTSLKGVTVAPGRRADFIMKPVGDLGVVFTYECITPPGIVIDGKNGLKGFPGNSGMMGGNSGSAFVENNSNKLQVILTSAGGKKGYKSEGGEGGEGGEPGIPGDGGAGDLEIYLQENGAIKYPGFSTYLEVMHGILTKKCDAAKAGNSGAQGNQGDPGNDGSDGSAQKSCVTSMDQKTECIEN
ncbi:MAG: hypothetical protein WA160_13885 [Pseudobdellovibrio sp.]